MRFADSSLFDRFNGIDWPSPGMLVSCQSTSSPKGNAPMPKLYEALAEAFLAEGVDTQFVLMGDGNMHWSTTFAKLPGVETVHVRHEHATVAAATAYNVATGKVAVASVLSLIPI